LDEDRNVGKWNIGSLKPKREFGLSGTFNLPQNFSDDEEADVVININFSIQNYIMSGA
jgi:hypothetical protein